MKANFHTHTYRCHHATGTEREYIELCIKKGLKVLGFSDHTPYIFDNDYYSDYRMKPEETEEYLSTINKLKEEYKKDIDIYVGFETEYYPKLFDTYLKFINQFDYDYLLLGQHYTVNEYDGKHTYDSGNTEKDLNDYVNQVVEGVKTGVFSYICHPDMLVFDTKNPIWEVQMKKICKCAKENNMPIEFNFNGLIQDRFYPNDNFFKLVAEMGNDVIFGLDAHNLNLIDNIEFLEEKALKILGKYGIKPIDNIKLRNGKIV
ncbi:MAG: histidinol-phosphatase [Clostridia bacterium]|nr:histidinol-phosphatase [Clostridia bacterium]